MRASRRFHTNSLLKHPKVIHSLAHAIDLASEFVADGIVHVDDSLYPLFIQSVYPDCASQVESFIEKLYQSWLDPAHESIIFLPDHTQEKFVSHHDFTEVVKQVYPENHHEKIAFLASDLHLSPKSITDFAQKIKTEQRQKLFEQGVRIVGIEDAVDHDTSHLIVLSYQQTLPAYKGTADIIMLEENKKSIVQTPCPTRKNEEYQQPLPAVLPIQSIKFLFNDPELFHERYVLNLHPPYQPTHHITTRVLKDLLLFDKPFEPKIKFDQIQIEILTQSWKEFKATLPHDVLWNIHVSCIVPGTNQTLYGTIDLIWDGGLYQLTKQTPPSRNAIMNGQEPELAMLAAAYQHPLTHVGYIHLKGYGEDPISITRYNDSSSLVSENIKKLACYYSRSQEKST